MHYSLLHSHSLLSLKLYITHSSYTATPLPYTPIHPSPTLSPVTVTPHPIHQHCYSLLSLTLYHRFLLQCCHSPLHSHSLLFPTLTTLPYTISLNLLTLSLLSFMFPCNARSYTVTHLSYTLWHSPYMVTPPTPSLLSLTFPVTPLSCIVTDSSLALYVTHSSYTVIPPSCTHIHSSLLLVSPTLSLLSLTLYVIHFSNSVCHLPYTPTHSSRLHCHSHYISVTPTLSLLSLAFPFISPTLSLLSLILPHTRLLNCHSSLLHSISPTPPSPPLLSLTLPLTPLCYTVTHSPLHCYSLLSHKINITLILHCHSSPLHSHTSSLRHCHSFFSITLYITHSSYTVTPLPYTPIHSSLLHSHAFMSPTFYITNSSHTVTPLLHSISPTPLTLSITPLSYTLYHSPLLVTPLPYDPIHSSLLRYKSLSLTLYINHSS